MVIVLAVCLFTFFKQRDHLKSENRLESLVSRESSFLFNNMVLLAACFTVLWGTLFPVLSEYVQGTKATVGAPFYNRVNLPIGLLLLLLTGVGPLLAWRSTSLRAIRRNFVLPGMACGCGGGLMLGGVRPWKAATTGRRRSFRLLAFSLAAGVVTAISSEFLRGAGVVRTQTGRTCCRAASLVRRNTRRYGGYLVHFGIVVMFIGIAGGAFNQSHEQEMGFGDQMRMGPYRWSARAIRRTQRRTTTRTMRCWTCTGAARRLRRWRRRSGSTRRARRARPWWRLTRPAQRSVRDLRGPQPGYGQADHQGVSESADAWIWIGVGIVVRWDRCGAGAESVAIGGGGPVRLGCRRWRRCSMFRRAGAGAWLVIGCWRW